MIPPAQEHSLLTQYGYTPETLENLQKMSAEGTNLQEMFNSGDYKMEHAGVSLEYDEQGKLTQDTYKRLYSALEEHVGALQAPPQGSQYVDDSGKPSLWQPGVQATGWAEKGISADSTSDSWWDKAVDYTESMYRKIFSPEDQVEVVLKSQEKYTGELNSKRLTGYAPGPGDAMEGGFETSRRGPDGKTIPRTLDDFRLGKADYVTIATGDRNEYGKEFIFSATYKSPIDGKMYSLDGIKGVVHDWCPICGANKLDVATGNFEGWSGKSASNFVDRSFSGKVGGVITESFSVSLSLGVDTLDWSAYAPVDLDYTFPAPQLAVSAPEFEVPGPHPSALITEYDIPGPFTPALITEYQTGGYDIPTFYADYAAPEPVSPQMPLYSGPDIASEPPQEYYVAQNEPSGAEFPGQPEPDNEHSQARQLVERAIDWTQDQYRSLNEGLQTLWDQEISRRIAGDFNMADNEWPLSQHEESFVQQEVTNAARTEREVDAAKWQAAYEQLVNSYQDPVGDFQENSATAQDIQEGYDDVVRARYDAERLNDPNQLTPSDGIPPSVADFEQDLSPEQKRSLEQAIASARAEEAGDTKSPQEEQMVAEVKRPPGADAKTLTEWYRENDKYLASREQRAADYDASLAGCGSGTYRGTSCQNNWLLKRYQDEAWADAYAVAASNARGPYEHQGDLQFDDNLLPVESSQRNLEASPEGNKSVQNNTPSVFESARDVVRNAYDGLAEGAQSLWSSVRDWWGGDAHIPSESLPVGDAPEPENIVGDYTPQDFSENTVTHNRLNTDPDAVQDASNAEDLVYAASNKESLSREDALAVKDAVDDATNDAEMEKEEAAKGMPPAQQNINPATQQAVNNLQSARQRLSSANSALAQAFRDARNGNVDVNRIAAAMSNLTSARNALQAAYGQASLSGGFTSSELANINNSITGVSSLVGEVSSYRPYLSYLNQGAVQQYWPQISSLIQRGNSVVSGLNRTVNAPVVMGYTRRSR